MKNKKEKEKGEIVIYKPKNGEVELRIKMKDETIWLNLDQIAALFGRDKSVISRHIKNIFFENELRRKSVVANFATTGSDGKTYKVDFYNLDVIISVGYRVNSSKATQFRIWATKTLKNYLLKGYVINEKRLLEAKEKFNELKNTIDFLQKKSKSQSLVGQADEILSILTDYAKTLKLLDQYDKQKIKKTVGKKDSFRIEYEKCLEIIARIKNELVSKGQAGNIFGIERDASLQGIIGNIYQTFGGKELYGNIEAKAAHLLYFIIKDHPFSDGNKRLGSFLFVYFLDKNSYLYRENGERKINDNALTALALLIAESNPKEKEQMVALVTQLLS